MPETPRRWAACSPTTSPSSGRPKDVLAAMDEIQADAIAIADSSTLDGPAVRRLAWSLEGRNVDLLVVPTITDVVGPRVVIRPVGNIPLLYVDEPELTGPNRIAKALFDRLAAAVSLLILGPIILGLALAVRLTSPGPAFYLQHRVGLDGRHFRMVKLRTMEVGRRRGQGRPGRGDRRASSVQDGGRSAGDAGSGASSAAGRSTSCRSCGTC